MAPSPSAPPRRTSRPRGKEVTPSRQITFTNALAEVLLPRSVPRRPARANPEDLSLASPELRKQRTKSEGRLGNLGTPLGPYDGNSVRDRVRKWQEEGGGVVLDQSGLDSCPPDVHSVLDEFNGHRQDETDVVKPRQREKHNEVDVGETANRSSRAKLKGNERIPREIARALSPATPKKRVVSDGHWVKKRETKANLSGKTEDPKDVPERCMKDNGARASAVNANSAPRKNREGNKRTPSAALADDDGIRVYSTPDSFPDYLESKRSRERPSKLSKLKDDSTSDEVLVEHGRPRTPLRKDRARKPSDKRSPSNLKASPTTDHEEVPQRSSGRREDRTAQRPTRSPPGSDVLVDRTKSRSLSARVQFMKEAYDEGRKIFQRPEPEPLPRLPGSRVEAWLNETSDPFVDSRPSSADATSLPCLKSDEGPLTEWEDRSSRSPAGVNIGEMDRSEGRSSGQRRGKHPKPVTTDTTSRPSSASFEQVTVQSKAAVRNPGEQHEEDPLLLSPALKRSGAKKLSSSPDGHRRKLSALTETVTQDDKQGSSLPTKPGSSGNIKLASEPPLQLNPMFKRPVPHTGNHQLSTIASVETLATKREDQGMFDASGTRHGNWAPSVLHDPICGSEAGDPDQVGDSQNVETKSTLKRRLTTHEDLMSVLSLPRAGSRSVKSARSTKSFKSKLSGTTITDLMIEFANDESKYMQELNTLVDGVIPVLLTCILSKSDSAIAAGLFRSSFRRTSDPNVTRPIIDMGIALERLKSLHKRTPLQSSDELLRWAHGARKVYVEYLRCWRMGFQDVVINLAPASEIKSEKSAGISTPPAPSTEKQYVDEGLLPRNAEGDVVDGHGKRVDVAYLLKRPLVRLKYLAKTLKGLNCINPSKSAEAQALHFQNLVIDARNRVNEERARLEDEAAASIDCSKVRDPCTLAPLDSVTIEQARHLVARDFFNLRLDHSSGQKVERRVELLLREDGLDGSKSGDLLICEVDETSRWLLYPPIASSRFSARNGLLPGELVVTIRGANVLGQEWRESLSLITDDEQASLEWAQMLRTTFEPSAIPSQQAFERAAESQKQHFDDYPPRVFGVLSPKDMSSSMLPAVDASMRVHMIPDGQEKDVRRIIAEPRPLETMQDEDHHAALHAVSSAVPISRLSTPALNSSLPQPPTPTHSATLPTDLNNAMMQAGSESSHGLRRAKAKRMSRSPARSPTHSTPSKPAKAGFSTSGPVSPTPAYRVAEPEDNSTEPQVLSALAPSTPQSKDTSSDFASGPHRDQSSIKARHLSSENRSTSPPDIGRPSMHRRISSVPSTDPPSIPKLRKKPPSSHSGDTTQDRNATQNANTTLPSDDKSRLPKMLRNRLSKFNETKKSGTEDQAPTSPPQHKIPSPLQLKVNTPALKTPTSGSRAIDARRLSSPLKHEYAPSSASESASEPEDIVDEDQDTFSATSSEEEELEDGDAPTPLLPIGALHRFNKVSPHGSIYSVPNATLTPSESASQVPYKTVPQQPTRAAKVIASIFSWSDEGFWKDLHPDECSVVIAPGLIEAFEMTASHSQPVASHNEPKSTSSSPVPEQGERPLVGLELTPLVPLRRGTALDISIRSPPTPRSKLSSGTNIMFRSRTPEECEALYAMINFARINNPTYIALQNARGPYGEGSSLDPNRRATSRRNGWWSWTSRQSRSSYRAVSAAAPSVIASESSMGTTTSAFSALRLFGTGGRFFNIAKSTISPRTGSIPNSVYSSSSSSSFAKDRSSTPTDTCQGAPIGLSDFKIRLYHREPGLKWRNMGNARLSIRRPPPGVQGHGFNGTEKRILITGRTAGETLLDVCLGETAFERVARTGIALSILEEVVGPNGEVGQVGAIGGVGPKTRVYMIQMKSEVETAYTYSLVGRLKY